MLNWRFIAIHTCIGFILGAMIVAWVYLRRPSDESIGGALVAVVILWAVLPPRVTRWMKTKKAEKADDAGTGTGGNGTDI